MKGLIITIINNNKASFMIQLCIYQAPSQAVYTYKVQTSFEGGRIRLSAARGRDQSSLYIISQGPGRKQMACMA